MFERAILATDLSPASDLAIRCLAALRPLGLKRVVLAHALRLRHLEDMAPLLAQSAMERLSDQQHAVQAQGIEAAVEIVPGTPMFEIHRVAAEHRASLIIAGSHRQTLAADVLRGGSAMAVVHGARLPVLMVNHPPQESQCADRLTHFEHVLFPTDFSDDADNAFRVVRSLVGSGVPRATILHVQDRARIDRRRLDEFDRIDRERLARLEGDLRAAGAADVYTRVSFGDPPQEILEYAASRHGLLIVMGRIGRMLLPGVVLGGVCQEVVRHAAAPVMIVPLALAS